MIFDFRVYLGQSFDGLRQTAEELLSRMDGLNIDMALAYPFKPISYNLADANAGLAADLQKYPDRLAGAARVDPWQPEAAQILERSLDFPGMRAVYLCPWEENYRADQDILDRLMAVALARKVPVVIATGYPWVAEALQVMNLATRWPEVTIVMTNGGQINISGLGQADAALALQRCSNLLIDTAGIYRQDFIEEVISTLGGPRVLFASGAPYFDQRYEIQRVLKANVSADALQAVQCENALQLLKIKN